ncbi:mismatch-specific DNA-glycosylase [Rhodococcus sp. NPDC058521]|uniref:mismatch-specific DNA-glycosylase n=1 Tax=Rhodococcus sp. NPDC058521 TaxID=3346536 RepID=UPI00366430AF
MSTRFDRSELESYRDTEVPDLIGPGLRLLFVGINPGLWTAATGAHFARPGNRFFPALAAAGIIERPIDPTSGLSSADREHLIARGVGITNLVARATAKADELTTDELVAGADRLRETVRSCSPRVVAIAGITAYRTGFGVRAARKGPQPAGLEGARLWVVPNPSGLNAHETVSTLAVSYAAAAEEAGIMVQHGS